MFEKMRRSERELTNSQTQKILEKVSFGTLAIDSTQGYPYSVPISFAYADNKIYFHGANAGLKYESILVNEKVSFSAVDMDDVVPSKFTTHYRSAVAYGKCRIVNNPDEISDALELIVAKYSLGFETEGKKYAKNTAGKFAVFCIDIEHLTGKSNA